MATTIDLLPNHDVVVSDGNGGMWAADSKPDRNMCNYSGYHLDHLDHLGSRRRVVINNKLGEWTRAIAIDVIRGRVYTFHNCYHRIQMIENGVVSDVVQDIDQLQTAYSMIFSPDGSADGSLIFSKRDRDQLTRFSLSERRWDVLFNIEDVNCDFRNMCWDRSPTRVPYTELYCEIWSGDGLHKLARLNILTSKCVCMFHVCECVCMYISLYTLLICFLL